MPLDMLITGRIATLAGETRVRLGRGRRDPGRADRLRRVRGRARDARRPVHRADRARARRGGDPGPDRRAPAPRRRGRRDPPGRPVRCRRRWRRGWPGSARRTRRRRRSRCLARGSRLGRGSLGPLAHRRRPRDGRAGPPRRVLGARPPRPARQPGRARRRPGWTRRPRTPAAASSGATRTARPKVSCTRRPPGSSRATSRRSRAPSWRAGSWPSRSRCWRSAWSPRTTRGGCRRTRSSTGRTRPTRACPSSSGCRSGCWPRCATTPSRRRSPAGCAAARSSARTHAVVPGSAGRSASRTGRSGRGRRRCWPTSNRNPTGRSRPSDGAACGSPSPTSCASGSSARRRAASRPRSTASATRRSGPRSTRSSRRPRACRSCPRWSMSSCWTRPMSAASPPPGSWRASSPRTWESMPCRPDGCGAIGPSGAATRGRRSPRPAPSWPSGRTRRSEPFDPWPGIALAVRREDPRWPAGTPAFAPGEALSIERALRAACVGPPHSAHELDRGRLTVGQRADIVVIPAASLDEPVEPGGALATTRPTMVLVDGRVAFEA